MENHYASESAFPTLPNADYSHFDRFRVDHTDLKWKAHTRFMRETYPGFKGNSIDSKLLMAEHRAFGDSAAFPGLQLVDIVSTTLRRALNDKLEEHGWSQLGRLFIRRNGSMFAQLGEPPEEQFVEGYALDVWTKLRRFAKQMSYAEHRFFGRERPPRKKGVPIRVTKVGRNDPCTCGTGKKFKKCCGA
jgi:hypothetical protein